MGSVDKWWLMIGCGVIVIVVGLITAALPVLVLGALLLIIGALAEGAEFLDLDLLRGRLVLKRETVEETMLRRALEKGISEKEATHIAAQAAASVPEEGAQISLGDANQVTASLTKGGSVVFILPEKERPDEELLAELFVDQQSKELLRAAKLRDVIREAGYENADLEDTLLHPETRNHETVEIAASTADDLLDAVGQVDVTKTLLIYPSGRFAVRTYELGEGEVTIGREETCDVVLHDSTVSSVHAIVKVSASGEVKIVDNDSTNGVLVNKEKIGVRKLCNRDLIEIGDRALLFVEPSGRSEEDDQLSTAN